jgi:hypothetical protein
MQTHAIKIFNLTLISIFVCCKSPRTASHEPENPCEKLDPHFIDHYRDTTLFDFAIRKNGILKDHIISRNNLSPLHTSTCSETLLTVNDKVKDKKVEINISSTTINLKHDDIEYVEVSNDYPKFIDKVNGYQAYGLFSDETTVKVIKDIAIVFGGKKLMIERTEYSNLFFPNFCDTFKAIQPLKAYKSKDEKFIYIYIFGANGLSRKPNSLSDVRSYLAKLIFSVKKGYIGKIILSNAELNAYQWDCSNFIGI